MQPRIELLAPAGNHECLRAAVANGADAVYFGLNSGFNARARAENFSLEELPSVITFLHRYGVRGYVTLNTLIFTNELPSFAETLAAISDSGTDAVLLQDVGAACLAREICPDLPVHASTQMTLTSAETIRLAEKIGAQRVVLARELSIHEITDIAKNTDMPLEVFVHGALCVAYSGQCLTSESLGGRSANRGQCAQACRLPYEVICDGEHVDLGNQKYLLSPQDLAGFALVPELLDAGVTSLKIEGRLKSPSMLRPLRDTTVRQLIRRFRETRYFLNRSRLRKWSSPFREDSLRGGLMAVTTRCLFQRLVVQNVVCSWGMFGIFQESVLRFRCKHQ